jgi:quinol monooxygenase YgiN
MDAIGILQTITCSAERDHGRRWPGSGTFRSGFFYRSDCAARPALHLRVRRHLDSTPPRVDASANLYVITNLDIAAANLTQAELALHDLATAVRQINGNRGVEILRQANHANHFNLISAWTGEAPFHAFAASVGARHFR